MFTPIDRKFGFEARWYDDDPVQKKVAQALLAQGKPITRASLYEYAIDNPQEAGLGQVVKAMAELGAKGGPKKGAVAAFRAEEAKRAAGGDPIDVDGIMRILEQQIIGQAHVVRQVRTILEGFPNDPAKALPYVLGMAGPPGVGKTELFRALSLAIYGDPNAVVIIRGGEIKSEADINTFFGAPPGYKGYSDELPLVWKPLGEGGIQSQGRPKLVLFDELDKVGNGDPEVIKSFSDALGNFLEDGKFRLRNGRELPLKDAIIGFASNAGAADVGARVGDEQRDHYTKAFKRIVPPHIKDRLSGVVAFDPHTPETLAQVAQKFVAKVIKEELGEAARDRGVDGQITFDPEVLKFLGEVGFHPSRGARAIGTTIRMLVTPEIRAVAAGLEDGERHVFELAPMDAAAKKKITGAFYDNEANIPDGIDRNNFPITHRCLNPKPGFFRYEASERVPHDPELPLIVHGSGVANGQGFLVSRTHRLAQSELHLLRPGLEEVDDQFVKVALPPRLAAARHDLKAVSIDDRQLLFLAVDDTKNGRAAEAVAALFDAKTGKWEDVPAPELPLVGASLVAGDGKAILFGGRVQEKLPDGSWSVDHDPLKMRGTPIENQAYLFDLATKEWRWVDNPPADGTVGAASVYHEGKAYLIGGEEIFRHQNMLNRSRASTSVNVFDFQTETWSRGPELPARLAQGVAFGTAFVDGGGAIQVVGGAVFLRDGKQLEESRTSYRLSNGAWKTSEMPNAGLCLSAVPQGEGSWVIGPFKREDESFGFDILRPRFE